MRAMKMLMGMMLLCVTGCRSAPRGMTFTEIPHQETLAQVTADQVYRVTTKVPFPRGLVLKDDKLYALARGRVREAGGADAKVDDQAGTIFTVDPNIAQPITDEKINDQVRNNGQIFAAPTAPPFHLFDRNVSVATHDRETDRPYCGLRYDPITQNFFLCAFSGIDKPDGKGSNFSKNLNDAVFRYDTRSSKWAVVEQHDIEKGGQYPHHFAPNNPPPHGWLNGPDNCLVVKNGLYVVSKDNSLLVRYDLSEIAKNPDAPPPESDVVLDHNLLQPDGSLRSLQGHSMLAYREGYLYVGYRTSSVIVRFPLDEDGKPKQPIVGQSIAQFDPYDPKTRKSANLTDMAFGPDGDLYVISAQPSRVFRFTPDPTRFFEGRTSPTSGYSPVWADLAQLTNNPKMKSENLIVDNAGRVFVTSGDSYDYQAGAGGTIYRIDPK